MVFIIPICTVMLCVSSFLLMLRDISEHKSLFQSEDDSDLSNKLLTNGAIVYSILMFIITVSASFLFCTIYKDNELLMSIKRLALLSILWPIAYIDYKTYRIPNVFIAFGAICRAVIFVFELLFARFAWITLLSEVVAAVALLLAAGLCAICIKNSIGFGDMKLFIIMGLMLSLNGIWSAIFLSLVVSFFISIFLLVTKKKTRKDAIPFGPAIVIGTYLSVCLSGM